MKLFFCFLFILFSFICSAKNFLSNLKHTQHLLSNDISFDSFNSPNPVVDNIRIYNQYNSNGFINLNLIQKSIKNSQQNSDSFRFLAKNKVEPEKDLIFKQKLGLSNGIILFGNKRTANFASDMVTNTKTDDVLNALEYKQDLNQFNLDNINADIL